MPASAARAVSSGRATSVSRATTARRCTSKGLKSGPWSRATSASRASSSSTKTWWYFLHSSPEPLHRERLRRHHQAALRPSRPEEAAQHEAGLDRLAEPHLVGQQPAHRVGGGRALGGVELVGEETDPPAQKRAETLGLPQRSQVQGVQPQGQVFDGIDVPGGQALDEVGSTVGRPDVAGLEPHERRGVARQPQRDPAGGKLDPDRPPLHGHDLPGSELRIVAVRQAVSDLPHPVHCRCHSEERPAAGLSPWDKTRHTEEQDSSSRGAPSESGDEGSDPAGPSRPVPSDGATSLAVARRATRTPEKADCSSVLPSHDRPPRDRAPVAQW